MTLPVNGSTLHGISASLEKVRELIRKVACASANVLILGESGTGKELVARMIHEQSERSKKNFVPINCGAIPAELLESELFGHQKGAFTGAQSDRRGRVEHAEGGTLFLDEIGDMSMDMQVKILRVLETRRFERVGSNESRTANIRVLAATHRDLEKEIARGSFRLDLYYRLNVFPVSVPALRARPEDILPLVDAFNKMPGPGKAFELSHSAAEVLTRYEWPGNVRELRNLVERLRILHPGGVVGFKDLPKKMLGSDDKARAIGEIDAAMRRTDIQLPPCEFDLKGHLEGVERQLIFQALTQSDGIVAHAARTLKLRRTTLVDKLKKYGIPKEACRCVDSSYLGSPESAPSKCA